jgi:hypothetical protein
LGRFTPGDWFRCVPDHVVLVAETFSLIERHCESVGIMEYQYVCFRFVRLIGGAEE